MRFIFFLHVAFAFCVVAFCAQAQTLPPSPCYLSKTVTSAPDKYVDYDLGDGPEGAWGLSICDLTETQPHFHKKGAGHFIVLSGRAIVALDGVARVYGPGAHIYVKKGVMHAFKSADPNRPVRILCVEVPLIDPKDRWVH